MIQGNDQFSEVVELRDDGNGLPAPVARARELFVDEHPGEGRGFPSKFDYRRYAIAYERVTPSESVLDVGVGSGQLINALAIGGACRRVCGIDVRWHTKLTRFDDGYELRRMDVADMGAFADGEFESTVGMEVLEHLDPEKLPLALAELRRVTRRRLLVTVPYCEPEPLPSYHRSRFTDADLHRLFPRAEISLLRKPGVPWALIEERFDG